MSKKIQNSMNSDGKSSGFTLLELLIVISIIAILAILTISNYAGVQRGARLDFAADRVVSLIKEQQQLAKSGNRDEGGNLQCYAFKLIVADEENQAQALIGSSNYVGLPKDENGNILSNPDPGSVDVCEKIEGGGWQERKLFQAGTVLQNISEIINGQELNSLELYFKPPFAQVYRYSEIDDFEPLLSGKFRFVVSFDRGGERERVVELNLQNGQVRRVPNSELNESGLLQSSSNLQLQAVPNVQLQAVPQGNGGLQLQQSPNLQINPQP